ARPPGRCRLAVRGTHVRDHALVLLLCVAGGCARRTLPGIRAASLGQGRVPRRLWLYAHAPGRADAAAPRPVSFSYLRGPPVPALPGTGAGPPAAGEADRPLDRDARSAAAACPPRSTLSARPTRCLTFPLRLSSRDRQPACRRLCGRP